MEETPLRRSEMTFSAVSCTRVSQPHTHTHTHRERERERERDRQTD